MARAHGRERSNWRGTHQAGHQPQRRHHGHAGGAAPGARARRARRGQRDTRVPGVQRDPGEAGRQGRDRVARRAPRPGDGRGAETGPSRCQPGSQVPGSPQTPRAGFAAVSCPASATSGWRSRTWLLEAALGEPGHADIAIASRARRAPSKSTLEDARRDRRMRSAHTIASDRIRPTEYRGGPTREWPGRQPVAGAAASCPGLGGEWNRARSASERRRPLTCSDPFLSTGRETSQSSAAAGSCSSQCSATIFVVPWRRSAGRHGRSTQCAARAGC